MVVLFEEVENALENYRTYLASIDEWTETRNP